MKSVLFKRRWNLYAIACHNLPLIGGPFREHLPVLLCQISDGIATKTGVKSCVKMERIFEPTETWLYRRMLRIPSLKHVSNKNGLRKQPVTYVICLCKWVTEKRLGGMDKRKKTDRLWRTISAYVHAHRRRIKCLDEESVKTILILELLRHSFV